jgi:hypothetical protein
MKHLLPYLERLWATDVALTALLVSLATYVFILHPLAPAGSVRLMAAVFFSLILIAGAMTASRNRIFRRVVFSWSVLTFIVLWAAYLFPSAVLVLVELCLALAFLLLLIVLIVGQVFRKGRTTSHRIMGAVAVYLLLGLTWSLIYHAIALQIPDAFKGLEKLTEGDIELHRLHLQYFSFTVLTTLGFGDIVPVHPIAQMSAVLEAMVGQLFPAILIARLVSLQLQSNESEKRLTP